MPEAPRERGVVTNENFTPGTVMCMNPWCDSVYLRDSAPAPLLPLLGQEPSDYLEQIVPANWLGEIMIGAKVLERLQVIDRFTPHASRYGNDLHVRLGLPKLGEDFDAPLSRAGSCPV